MLMHWAQTPVKGGCTYDGPRAMRLLYSWCSELPENVEGSLAYRAILVACNKKELRSSHSYLVEEIDDRVSGTGILKGLPSIV